MANRIVIDGDSLSFYSSKEDAHLSLLELDARLNNIFKITDASSYLIVLSDGNYFRHALYKDYKALRSVYREKQKTFTKTLKAYLKDEYGAISVDKVEADDVVAYIKNKFPDVVVCSPDKDVLQQIPGTHYDYRWKLINGNTIDEQTEEGRWVTTTPEQAELFLWIQCLMGDPTDGVKGIPGIGVIKATNLLSSVEPSDYCNVVLREYKKRYGDNVGIFMFQLNYRLLYLLRSEQDFINEGISFLPIESMNFIDLSNSNSIVQQWNI